MNTQFGGHNRDVYIYGFDEGKPNFKNDLRDFPVTDASSIRNILRHSKNADEKELLEHKQKFAMLPYNACTSDFLLNLRGVLNEGYGGFAIADVIFGSDERCIVIQTIWNYEDVVVHSKVRYKKWNSYNEVFFIDERTPSIKSVNKLCNIMWPLLSPALICKLFVIFLVLLAANSSVLPASI